MSPGESEHGIPGLRVHADSSVTRPVYPSIEADGITSTDVVIRMPGSHSIGARVFLPKKSGGEGKLPLVLYFHGGGFVLCKPDTWFYHGFCESLAERLDAVIVSVDYRLAPEHRLPAAYQDGILALRWLEMVAGPGSSTCPLLADHVDFSRCFAFGDSAGGNIIHNVLLADGSAHVTKIIKGAVLLQPFFGGVKRTEQELRMRRDRYISLAANDIMWELALPQGWNKDCQACNPVIDVKRMCSRMMILVVVGGMDPMYERQVEYVKRIKGGGGDVKLVEYKSASHGFMVMNVTKPAHDQALLLLLNELKDFISGSNRHKSNVSSKL